MSAGGYVSPRSSGSQAGLSSAMGAVSNAMDTLTKVPVGLGVKLGELGGSFFILPGG